MQRIYNNIGILLMTGIIGGTGLLFIKYSDDKKEPIKITHSKQTPEQNTITPAESAVQAKKVNINRGTLEELDALLGIGPAMAQKIIDWRNQNGPFKVLEDLKKVPGIGETKFENIKDQVSL